jgi:hypothetical protein
MFFILAAPRSYLGRAVPDCDGLAAFFSYPVLIALAIALCVLSGV